MTKRLKLATEVMRANTGLQSGTADVGQPRLNLATRPISDAARCRRDHSITSSAPEEKFDLAELGKNMLDPTRQFIFQ